jgi:hypothetical protein
MKIIINIILNLVAVMYNVACVALNNFSCIIAVRKTEFKIKRSIVQCPLCSKHTTVDIMNLCGNCVECDTEMYLD